jgi:hypothetical protein
MFAQRASSNVRSILSAPRSIPVGSRSFVAGASLQSSSRAPALADITPDAAASFNKKQKEFRDGLVAAQKQKEQQESTSHPRDRFVYQHIHRLWRCHHQRGFRRR